MRTGGNEKAALLLFVAIGGLLLLVVKLALSGSGSYNSRSRFWAIGFSPKGRAIASVGGASSIEDFSEGGELILWDPANGKGQALLKQEAPIRAVKYAPDGSFLVTGDMAGVVRIFAAASEKSTTTFRCAAPVNAVAVGTGGGFVAGGCLDGTITLWDVAKKTPGTISLPNEKVISLDFSPRTNLLIAGGQSGKAYLIEINGAQSPPRECLASTNNARVEAVAFSPDGEWFATGCQKDVKLWSSKTVSLIRDLPGLTASVDCLTFSPRGKTLASVDLKGMVRIWSLADGTLIQSKQAHEGVVFSLAFSPDGASLATAGRDDFHIKIWDADSLTLTATIDRADVKGNQKEPKP